MVTDWTVDGIRFQPKWSSPIAGTAPRLRLGLEPDAVASRIIAAIRAGEREVPADAFGT